MLYVNVSGMYGCGMKKAEYRTLDDLLDAMDRLGVWASVAARNEGRDMDAAWGNRLLMDDIASTPRARDRILPSFSVAPSMLFAPEEFEHLKRCLESGEVSFVSVYPVSMRHALLEIERVLSLIADCGPVVLISVSQMRQSDYPELVTLARRFPGLHFVVQYAMWPQFSALADVMWRCPNVHMDISRMHVRGAIESVVSHFGKGRALFGLGSAALCGASMAMLRYASVEEETRRGIAGETLLSLMRNRQKAGQAARSAPDMRPRVNNSYWEPFMAGKGVQNTPLIDAHAHIGPLMCGWFVPGSDMDGQLDTLDRDMERFGIQRMIVSPISALYGDPVAGNRLAEEKAAGHERVRGYWVFNPHYADEIAPGMLEDAFSRPYFIGFKLLPDYWQVRVDDPVFNPMWEYADRHCLPVLIHTWEGGYDTPDLIAPVAKRYPNVFFLLGHAGGGTDGRAQAVSAARRYGNVYLEFCGSFTADTPWEDTVAQVGADRVIFGTDTYPHDIAWELGRLLSTDISDEALKAILGANMANILAQRKD